MTPAPRFSSVKFCDFTVIWAVFWLFSTLPVARAEDAPPLSFSWPAMGTRAELLVRGPDAKEAGPLMRDAACAAISRTEAALSVFRPDSDVARVNAAAGNGEWVGIGAEFAEVLEAALATARASGGAFNPLVTPFLEYYGFVRRPGRGGDASGEPPAIGLLDLEAVEFDPADGRCRLARSGMALDLGGCAKGYAVDGAVREAAAVLRERGFTADFLLNLGGNMRSGGGAWTIGVRDPRAALSATPLRTVRLRPGEAVATSGSYERHVTAPDGRQISHILDPRTGQPVDSEVLQVTVFAPDALRADLFSTTLFVLGQEAGDRWLPQGARAVWVLAPVSAPQSPKPQDQP